MIKSIIDYLVEIKGMTKQKAMLWVMIPQVVAMLGAVATGTWQFAKYAQVLDNAYSDVQTIKAEQEITRLQMTFLINSIYSLSDSQGYASENIFKAMGEYAKVPINKPLIERIEEDVKKYHEEVKQDMIKREYKIVVKPMKK